MARAICTSSGAAFEKTKLVATAAYFEKGVDKKTADKPKQLPKKASTRKAYKLDPFKKEQGKELLTTTAQLGLGVLLIGGVCYIAGGTQALNVSLLMGPLINSLLTKPLSNFGNKLCILFAPALVKPSLRKAMNLKKQCERRMPRLSRSMQVFLDSAVQRYLYIVEHYNFAEKHYERAIEEVLRFPTAPKKIEPDIARITDFVKNYPTAVRTAIGDFVVSTITDAKVEHLAKKTAPIMFVGPPGTGKTHLAKKLGKLLDLPVHLVDLSRYKNINGNNFFSEDPEKGILVDALLGEETSEKNFSNKILVLDEIDKVLARDKNGGFIHQSAPAIITFLHTLLERQETISTLQRYDNASHDIAHLKIILIGNRTFTEVLGEDNAGTMESRVTVVKFDDGFQEEQKLSIARAYVATQCQSQGLDAHQVDQHIIASIVKADTQAGYKGVRMMLNVIDQYLRILEQGALIGQVAGTPPCKFSVEKAYNKHSPFKARK